MIVFSALLSVGSRDPKDPLPRASSFSVSSDPALYTHTTWAPTEVEKGGGVR